MKKNCLAAKRELVQEIPDTPFHISMLGIIDARASTTFTSENLCKRAAEKVSGYYRKDRAAIRKPQERMFCRENGEGLITYSRAAKHKTVFLFCKLVSGRARDMCMIAQISCKSKIWLNGRIVAGTCGWLDGGYVARMEKGDNVFVIELANPVGDVSLSIRLSDCDYERLRHGLLDDNYSFRHNEAEVIVNSEELYEKQPLSLMLIPGNRLEIDAEQTVRMRYQERLHSDGAACVDIAPISFLKEYIFDSSLFPCDESMALNHPRILFDYVAAKGEPKTVILDIFTRKVDFAAFHRDFMSENRVDEDAPVDKRAEMLYHSEQFFGSVSDMMHNAVNLYNSVRKPAEAYNGIQRKYYISKLDHKPCYYSISLPDGYDNGVKYPLFATLSASSLVESAKHFREYPGQPVIAADISTRGVTMGSYIGEAAVMEALELIKESVGVDERRVYLAGFSNGAASAWILAQHYPHCFAGIIPVSGRVSVAKAGNLWNSRIINTSSEYEALYEPAFANAKEILEKSGHFDGILQESMSHSELRYARTTGFRIDEMLKAPINEYPKSIRFLTDRHRYRQAYWLKIHSIEFGEREASVEVDCAGSRMDIVCRNVPGLSITAPPFCRAEATSIYINGQHVTDTKSNSGELHFVGISGKFEQVDAIIETSSRKGTGLLDVYLGPLRIYSAERENQLLMRAANAFARPTTNGYDPHVQIRYPVITAAEYAESEPHCGFVVIDDNSGDAIAEAIRKSAPIATDIHGYSYNGTRVDGPYLILQAMPNRMNRDMTVLYINTNKPALLNKCLFTRNLVLPSYYSGIHEYLNNEALVYDGRSYRCAYEWGMPLQPMK